MLLTLENAAELNSHRSKILEAQRPEYLQRNRVEDSERKIVKPLPFARHLEDMSTDPTLS